MAKWEPEMHHKDPQVNALLNIAEALTDLYSLVARGRPDDAIDILFQNVDELLTRGDFAGCDELLRVVDLNHLDTNLVVALLSITAGASAHLRERGAVFARAKEVLLKLSPSRADRLLDGLG